MSQNKKVHMALMPEKHVSKNQAARGTRNIPWVVRGLFKALQQIENVSSHIHLGDVLDTLANFEKLPTYPKGKSPRSGSNFSPKNDVTRMA